MGVESNAIELHTRQQLSHDQVLTVLRGWVSSRLLFCVPELRFASLRTTCWLFHHSWHKV